MAFSSAQELLDERKESGPQLSDAGPSASFGPLLDAVVDAQREAELIVGDHQTLLGAAKALVGYALDLGSPVVWPVGEAADRLAGAAALVAEGQLRLRGWTDHLEGERVVVLAISDLTPLALQQAARHARRLGAVEIHGCRMGLTNFVDRTAPGFDSYSVITPAAPATITVYRG